MGFFWARQSTDTTMTESVGVLKASTHRSTYLLQTATGSYQQLSLVLMSCGLGNDTFKTEKIPARSTRLKTTGYH